MKKVIISIFLLITTLTFSETKEILVDSDGNKIILYTDKTWDYEKRVETVDTLEQSIVLSNVVVSPRRNTGRSITGEVTNRSRKKLDYITYKIKWMVDGDYSTVKMFTIKDLGSNETKTFDKRVHLRGIPGRDYKIVVSDFKWDD